MRGCPTVSEVVEHEVNALTAVSGAVEEVSDEFLCRTAEGSHGGWVPDVSQERLHLVRQPEAAWVCVLHAHQDVAGRDDHALFDRSNAEGESATVLLHDVLPS